MISTRNCIYLLFIIFVGCATPNMPEGGPKDTSQPIAQNYSPENLSKNFKQKDISIFFDEWIQVANLNQQLIISPPIKPDPIITARKNQLNIHFKEDLKPNTTYSIFFGDAVKDNNEGNIISNLNYVFSTGPQIDSLSISGQVTALGSAEVPKNTFVQLYKQLEDSIITKEKPLYIYKVDKDGQFKLNYLPQDTFKLFVLNDLNTNYIYDLPTEWIGKYDSTIILTKPKNQLKLDIALPESEQYKLVDYNSTLNNNILTIELNKELNPQNDTISLQISNSKQPLFYNPKYTNKYFSFYIPTDSETVKTILKINNITIDSLSLKRSSKSSEKGIFLPIYQLSSKDSILSDYENRNFLFISSIPVEKINKNKISFVSDKDTIHPDSILITNSNWDFKIIHELNKDYHGKLVFLDSAVLFMNGQYSSLRNFTVKYTPSSDYGQIYFKVHLPLSDATYIIRIINENGWMIDEILVLGDTLLNYQLQPKQQGTYHIEVIEDVNHSFTWNGSSFWQSRKPERIFISQTYQIRPNWEDNYDIDVVFTHEGTLSKPLNVLEKIKELNKKVSKPKSSSTGINSKIIPMQNPNLPNFKKSPINR